MITDWDDAYANGAYIPGADEYVANWELSASDYKITMEKAGRVLLNQSYGPHPREAMEIFLPEGDSKGLVVFVHGGYWRSRDRDLWLHLAAGSVARGWTVAMPGYALCPEVRIADITRSIASAIEFAADKVDGPIHLAGHSAGGHLVARMGCKDVQLACAERIKRILAISGVHDLRPMLKTEMNEDFQLTPSTAVAESPALLAPDPDLKITCWVGADERPEFVRQNALLSNIWTGFGIDVQNVEEEGHNHFSVIESLAYADGPLTEALVG